MDKMKIEGIDVDPISIKERIQSSDQLKGVVTEKLLDMFAEYASQKSGLDLKEGISSLVDGYIDNCGISVSTRTVYYDAAQELLELFLKTDDPLAKSLNEEDEDVYLFKVMDRFNPDFTDDLREYDITGMDLNYYLEIAAEDASYMKDDQSRIALCFGTWLVISKWLDSLDTRIMGNNK